MMELREVSFHTFWGHAVFDCVKSEEIIQLSSSKYFKQIKYQFLISPRYVWGFISYTQFCPKLYLPSTFFSMNAKGSKYVHLFHVSFEGHNHPHHSVMYVVLCQKDAHGKWHSRVDKVVLLNEGSSGYFVL